MNSPSKAVPLVSYSPAQGYSVNPEALQVLRMLPDQDNYAVATVVGKAKTGKSFLLNQLLGDARMFPVNPHLANCTKGLMLATNFLQVGPRKVLLLDAQGFGSTEGSDDRDCKLFVLSLLLSSVVVFNSAGTIDEQTLNSLSMVIEVGKAFEKELDSKRSMPSLLWVLRDFSLQLLDKQGFPITPAEYLEGSLEEQKGSSQVILHKNRIRRVIKSVFSDRACTTLVLPSDTPESLDSDSLRPEFIEDIARCRQRLESLINRKGCKEFCGQKMTISNFIQALQTYVDGLNKSLRDGSLPRVDNMAYKLRENQAKTLRLKFTQFLRSQRGNIVNSLLAYYEGSTCQKQQLLEPVETFYRNVKVSILQLTGGNETGLQEQKNRFYEEIQRECQQFLRLRDQSSARGQRQELEGSALSQIQLQVNNLCEFFARISEDQDLDQEYSSELHRLKERGLKLESVLFANFMMKLQIAYLRRKLELVKQKIFQNNRSTIELQYARKEISRLETANEELETKNEQLETLNKDLERRENKNTFVTPVKGQPFRELSSNNRKMSTFGKQPGYIRTVHQGSALQNSVGRSAQQSLIQESRQQGPSNSSFYVPYVQIEKSEYLNATIVRTLIKEDSKRNSYIQYVIQVALMGQKWALNRKFKDFSELHSIMVMMFQYQRLPECRSITGPLKLAESNSAARKQLIEQRRRELENYLLELIQADSIRNSRILQKFLKINKEYTVL